MSKLGEYITGPQFMDTARRGVEKAIAEQRERGIEPACSPMPPELRRRREAIDFAVANVGLEGFELSPEFRVECERFARGEIELEDLRLFLEKRSR